MEGPGALDTTWSKCAGLLEAASLYAKKIIKFLHLKPPNLGVCSWQPQPSLMNIFTSLLLFTYQLYWASLAAQMVKNQLAMQETWVLGQDDSLGEGNSHTLQYSCLENSTDRSLAGYSPWGRKMSDTTDQLKCTHAPVVLLCREFLTKQTHFSLQLTAFYFFF